MASGDKHVVEIPADDRKSIDAITATAVELSVATDEQRKSFWQLNGASWAPPMTLEQYLGREETLRQTALSQNGGTTYYVLTAKGYPNCVVSGCEVTSKTVLIAEDGEVKEAKAYSIASVFTNPEYRGKGMAAWMLKRIQEEVDKSTECGALFSDIGRKYYTELGWNDWQSPQLTFKLEKEITSHILSGVVFLKEDDVELLCELDIKALKEKFAGLAGDGKTHLAFLPSFTQMAWHFARDKYVAKVMTGRDVMNRGAKTEDGKAWLFWDHDLREQKLKILRIVTNSEDDFEKQKADVKALLRAALEEANDWKLPKVLVWNPPRAVADAAVDMWYGSGPSVQITLDERHDGSIPSLRWKGSKDLSSVVWEENEYFEWC